MGRRGFESAAALAVVPLASVDRLKAPTHLGDAERAVWVQVVNDQPADAFTPVNEPLLELYCRHIVRARVLADEIEAFSRAWMADDDGLKRYDRMLAMAERESRAASSLATRLRITRQATSDPKTVGRANSNLARTRKPWELPA